MSIAKNSPYAQFKTDANIELAGINLDFGDFAIRIARAGGSNKKYAKSLMKHLKPHRKAYSTGTLDPKKQDAILARVYAESVVLDWANVVDRDGKIMEFSVENCVKLLTDLPELFRQIVQDAENYHNFKEVETEEIAKN